MGTNKPSKSGTRGPVWIGGQRKPASTTDKSVSAAARRLRQVLRVVLVSKPECSSRDLLIQTFQNRALAQRAAAITTLGQFAQCLFHGFEGLDFLLDIGDFGVCARPNVLTL